MSSCKPILIDMLLGIFNFALYAAYLKAIKKKLHIFLASGRSNIIFESGNDGTNDFGVIEAEDAVVSSGLHPNAVETNLTNQGPNRRPPEHMIKLDEGVSRVLEPLDGARIRRKGDEQDSFLKSGRRSDFFQRLYILRVTGIVEDPQEEEGYDYNIDYKALEDALKELRKAEAKLDKANEEYNDTREELKVTKKARKDTEKVSKEAGKETRILQKTERKANRAAKAKQEKQERKEISEQQIQEKSQKRQRVKDQANDKLGDAFGLL